MINELTKLEERRQLLLATTEPLTVEQYNFIPHGSNNNIIWNIGHLLVTGDDMLYNHTNIRRPEYDIDTISFGRGSKPDQLVQAAEIQAIRLHFLQTVVSYKAAVELIAPSKENINYQLLQFMLFHEEMHFRKIRMLMMAIQ